MLVSEHPSIACDSRNIASKFVIHATRFPDDVAIVEDGRCVTYGWLLRHAHALAVQLRSGHQPGAVVAIHGRRNVDTPLAMIACLLANTTFVVIDAAYVQQRILDILMLSGAKTLLHAGLGEDLRGAIATSGIKGRPIRCEPGDAAERLTTGVQETAYLLFTSGSTGFPKGIRTGHAPLVHFVEWYRKQFQPGSGSRFSMLAGLSHDPMLRDVFVPLSTGGQLHIPRQADILVPDRLFAWMHASAIEYTHLTPQLIDILHTRRERERVLDCLKFVFSGGDVLRSETARQVETIAPGANLVNFYGTSETPQAMAYQVIEPGMTAPYPLGRPIEDVDIEIVDDDLRVVPTGERGEIAIITGYLSDGYITHPSADSMAAKRQVYVSWARDDGKAGQRTYLTGDLGSKDENGLIFFHGRRDDQVKVRGYRVDCAEVAAAIERHHLAQEVVVLPERTISGEMSLMAFIVGDTEKLKRVLPSVVPAHMVPATVIGIPSIPLLPNGKTNRSALYELRSELLKQEQPAESKQENTFYKAVAEALDVPRLDPDKSFVGMGGDSLSFIKVGFVIEDYLKILPAGWEKMPFSALFNMRQDTAASANQAGRMRIKYTEPAILLRAASILLVVLIHAQADVYVTATSTLFVIAGMSFARFILPGLLDKGDITPTLRFILKYGVPAGLWQAASGLAQHQFWLPDVLLLGTLWANPAEHLTFWFLDILTVNLLIIAGLAISASRVLRHRTRDVYNEMGFHFSMAVLTLAIIAFFLQTQLDLWNGVLGVSSVGPFRWLWLVALGLAIQMAHSQADRLLVTGIALALATLRYGNLVTKGAFEEPFSVFLIGSIFALVWVRRIAVPAFSYGSILLLAQHSLFIYLFSMWVPKSLMPKLVSVGLPNWLGLKIVLALAIGIVMSLLWNRFLGIVSSRLGKGTTD